MKLKPVSWAITPKGDAGHSGSLQCDRIIESRKSRCSAYPEKGPLQDRQAEGPSVLRGLLDVIDHEGLDWSFGWDQPQSELLL
jgi:hypothetical protein